MSPSSRLVGIDGKAKASKSLGNAIYLSDTPEEVKRKVFQMYTDPNHIKLSDPGQVQGNVVFTYLDAFSENKAEVASLKEHYEKGGLGDTTIKNVLNTTLQNLLEPIRQKREALKLSDVREILYEGSLKAKKIAQSKIEQVRQAIGINYF